MNELLREHVTSIGFALTLSKRQIELLSLLHYYGGYDKMAAESHRRPHFITTVRSLMARGLVEHPNNFGFKVSKAGVLVADLLAEAGLYQEALESCGIELDAAVAS